MVRQQSAWDGVGAPSPHFPAPSDLKGQAAVLVAILAEREAGALEDAAKDLPRGARSKVTAPRSQRLASLA